MDEVVVTGSLNEPDENWKYSPAGFVNEVILNRICEHTKQYSSI
tara:strand:- start:210 stop:341 length:132 start_codon:yes stop_codon:yes gene_type:complete